jgi:hypothetical protein
MSLKSWLFFGKHALNFLSFGYLTCGILIVLMGIMVLSAFTSEHITTVPEYCIFLFVAGSFLIFLSSFGFFGTANYNSLILKIYFICVTILICFEIFAVVYLNVTDIVALLNYYWDSIIEESPSLITKIELQFQCCGFNSLTDRAIPPNCNTLFHYVTDCKTAILESTYSWRVTLIIISSAIGIIEVSGQIITFVLFRMFEKEKRLFLHEGDYINILNPTFT